MSEMIHVGGPRHSLHIEGGGVGVEGDQQAVSATLSKGARRPTRPLLHRLSTATRNASVDFSSWESSVPSRTRRANFIVAQKSRIYRQSMEEEDQFNNAIQQNNGNNNEADERSKKKVWRSFVRYMKEAWTGVISGTGMQDIYKCISGFVIRIQRPEGLLKT